MISYEATEIGMNIFNFFTPEHSIGRQQEALSDERRNHSLVVMDEHTF